MANEGVAAEIVEALILDGADDNAIDEALTTHRQFAIICPRSSRRTQVNSQPNNQPNNQ